VEPAPEIVPGAVLVAVAVVLGVLLALLELLDVLVEVELVELELPHAARPNASTAQPASALNLFLITASPLAGLFGLTAREQRAFRLSGVVGDSLNQRRARCEQVVKVRVEICTQILDACG
jgi:hypothetical protein